jgi:DNA-binding winged helix-turn-helix (wHTH) protein
MEPVPILHFGPFSLDGPDDGLWCDSERCKLTAKAEAVLRYLVAHPGRLVRRGDLLAAVWPDVYINEWVLTTCIREIRHVLGDVAKAPQYIATVHRQGYRFIAPVAVVATSSGFEAPPSAPPAAVLEEEHKLVTLLCGALAEAPALAAQLGPERWYHLLQAHLAEAMTGQGQVVGVVGAAGMGKTRLLREFCHKMCGDQVAVYAGQCLSYGQATPYLPVRDLVRQMCGLAEGAEMAEHATAVQQRLHDSGIASEDDVALMLQLLDLPVAAEALAGLSPAARQVRTFALLRHLVLAAAQRQPLILVVENLHWSDPTSEAWLASLVERLSGAAVLLLGTYRPGYQPPLGGTRGGDADRAATLACSGKLGRLEETHTLAERALVLAREHQERGNQAYALHLLGDIAAHREPPQVGQAEAHYHRALALAEELGMRPLQAHCHLGLGFLYARIDQREQARTELSTAIDLYRAMDMALWLPQAEAALAQVA